MGADLSRARFDALRDHRGVVLQQGRLLLDADWNELVEIVDRRLRAAAADLGSPGLTPGYAGVAVVPRTTPDGFLIGFVGSSLTISPGRMYVDGLLAENHGAPALAFDPLLADQVGTAALVYEGAAGFQQPHWPTPTPLPTTGTYLVYLDVWDREVTYLQEPDLVEPAVGVDTTARTQTVWQVRTLDVSGAVPDVTCATKDVDVPGWLALIAPSAGRLTTGTVTVAPTDNPCELPPTGDYRGTENQTYRVEIHDGGATGTATFKWSRDNGSVAMPVVSVVSNTAAGGTLRPENLGRDDVLNLATGNWVEILDDHCEFDQRPGELRKITVNDDRTISFAPGLPASLVPADDQDAALRHLRVRRWDQHGLVRSAAGGAPLQDLDAPGSTGLITVPVGGSTAIVLENGITVKLAAPTGVFRTGDYWIFTARVADNTAEELLDKPPLGIHHHYARLAVVTAPNTVTDCRTLWPPLDEGGCGDCSVCVTPQSHASGALTIQDAVNTVQPTGGTVCLAVGTYHLDDGAVRIADALSVRVHGQGPRTLLVCRAGAFEVIESAFVRLSDFAVVSPGAAPAIRTRTTAEVEIERVAMLLSDSDAAAAGIEVTGVAARTRLRDNDILAPRGIAGGDGTEESPVTLTADFEVTGNVLACALRGIDLDGGSGHLWNTVIRDNTVVHCVGGGSRTLGALLPDSTFEIADNTVLADGAGIVVGAGGYAVRNNEVTGTTTSLEKAGQGIVVARSSLGTFRGSTRITGNAVHDVGEAGILVLAPVTGLDVGSNTVDGALRGIVMEEAGRADTARVHGNEVRNIGTRQSDRGDGLAGIQLVATAHVEVSGNTVLDVGGFEGAAAGAVGVRVVGCRESRVHANVTERIGLGQAAGSARGIAVNGPFARAAVYGNQTRRSELDVDSEQVSNFVGLLVGTPSEANQPIKLGNFFTLLGKVSFVVGSKMIWGFARGEVCATIEGNVAAGSGRGQAVLIDVGGDVVVSSNQCWQAANSGLPALDVRANSATVNANRARAGKPSIAIAVDPARMAFLGNVMTSGVVVPGGLDPKWQPLNVDGV